jgi:hypothetical protein
VRVRALVILAALIALAVVAPSAQASLVSAVQQAGAVVTPTKAGTVADPQAVSLTMLASFDPAQVKDQIDSGNQFAMVTGEILFPHEGTTNARLFPGCAPGQVLINETNCPSGSQIGSGTAVGIGLNLVERVTIKLFNRPNGAGVTALVVSLPSAPVELRDIVVSNLTKLPASDPFGWRVDFTIPTSLLSPVAGVLAAVQQIRLTVARSYLKRGGRYVYRTISVRRGGRTVRKRVRIPYIATTGCRSGNWHGRFTAGYTTALPVDPSNIDSRQTVDVRVPCRE